MRREKPPGRQKGARLFSMLLAVCLMIAALPLSVSAAGEYVPGNPRWSGYQNQVQWDRPAGAASGDSFEYEAQLLLGDDVVESKAVEIDTYLFFTNDVVTRPQEEYTIRVRARWIMIVGDPDGQYMVADVGEWGPWATKAGSGGGEAEPPHEHSYTQKHDAAQHWQACSCGDKKDAADHSFGAWTADGNTESRTCTVCGYAETRDAAQTSATGETTDNGQDSGGEGTRSRVQRCYGCVYRPHERRQRTQGAACFPKVGRRAQGGVHRKIRADRTGMGCIFPDDFLGQQRPGDRRLPVPVQADGGTAYLRPVRKDGYKIPHHYVPALPQRLTYWLTPCFLSGEAGCFCVR